MDLFYRKIGQGKPLFILHGLFGLSDNWNSLGKKFADAGFEVYLVDLRNHGNSPHANEWNYDVMSDDLKELIIKLGFDTSNKICLMGHSMGGKVAMQFALNNSSLIDKLIVVDIGPKYHTPDNKEVYNALNAIDISTLKSRKEAEDILINYIPQWGVRQFLLKNIYWNEQSSSTGVLDWKFNYNVILPNIDVVCKAIVNKEACIVNTLFIRGEHSNYILNEDWEEIKKMFPNASLKTIEKAGHWVHADNTEEFYQQVIVFII